VNGGDNFGAPGLGEPGLDELRAHLGLPDVVSAQRLADVRSSQHRGDEWVLFAGAGVSVDAGLPQWGALVELVAERFGVDLGGSPVADLPGALQLCRGAAPDDATFWSCVSGLVCGSEPGPLHRALVDIPYVVLATTNFDCLLDAARLASTGKAVPSQAYPEIKSTKLTGGIHVYLHGRCNHEDGAPGHLEDGRCVLSRSDYDIAYGNDRLPHAVKSLFLDGPVLFVGTSFSDEDIQALLASVRRLEGVEARLGHALTSNRRVALVPGRAGDVDVNHSCSKFGIDPIRYLAPDDDHSGLSDIIRWLAADAPPRVSFREESHG
jgi:hypothetical protein